MPDNEDMKTILITFSITIFLCATLYKYIGEICSDKPGTDTPCRSSVEAKKERIYVSPAHFVPEKILFKGQTIEINEAWLERHSKWDFILVWYSYRKAMDGYQLCFTLKSGREAFKGVGFPFFCVEGYRKSFGSLNLGELFYETLPDLPKSLNIQFRTAWDMKNNPPMNMKVIIDR